MGRGRRFIVEGISLLPDGASDKPRRCRFHFEATPRILSGQITPVFYCCVKINRRHVVSKTAADIFGDSLASHWGNDPPLLANDYLSGDDVLGAPKLRALGRRSNTGARRAR